MSVTRGTKRSRDKSVSKNKLRSTRAKKVNFIADDEIPSDSDEEVNQEDQLNDEDLEDSDADETAQEKKLRLTKRYLEELKNLKAESDEDGLDEDVVGEKLQEDVLEQAGKLQKKIADRCKQPELEKIKVLRGHKLPVTCIVLSPDERFLFSSAKDCCIVKWDASETKKLFKIKGGHRCNPKITHTGYIVCLAISSDNKFLVSGGKDKLIHVWNVETCEHVHRFQGHRGSVNGLTFRLNSHQLFSASSDRCVKVWNLDVMGYVETLFGHQNEVQDCDSLTRERCVTVGGRDGSVRIWKIVEESQLIYHGHAGCIDCIQLINEEHFITGADDGSVCLWSVMKKKPLLTINDAHPDAKSSAKPWITAVTALRNSDLVATGSSNGHLKIWKCGPKFLTLDCLFSIPVTGFINSLQFTPTGNKLYVGVGQEHKQGRWQRIKEARNSVLIISLFDNK